MLKFFCGICRKLLDASDGRANGATCRNCGAITQTLVPNIERAESQQRYKERQEAQEVLDKQR